MGHLPAAAMHGLVVTTGHDEETGPDLDVCPHKVGFSIARMRYNYQVEAEMILMFPEIPSIYVFVRCREDSLKRYLHTRKRIYAGEGNTREH